MVEDAREPETMGGAKAQGRGIALMLLCTFCFAVMDGLSKMLIVRYPVGEIMFIRYAFFLLVVIALTRPRNVAASSASSSCCSRTATCFARPRRHGNHVDGVGAVVQSARNRVVVPDEVDLAFGASDIVERNSS